MLKKAEGFDFGNIAETASKLKGAVPSGAIPAASGTIRTQSPFTDTESNINLTPIQWLSTFDKNFKSKYPALAALNEINSPTDYKLSPMFSFGSTVNKGFNSFKNFSDPFLNAGPLIGGLYSVAPGALLGALSTGAYNMFMGNDLTENMGRNTAVGAGLGGLLGAISGYYRTNKVDPMASNKIKTLTPSQIDEVRKQEQENVRKSILTE